MVEYAERSIQAWADGQTRDAQADMMQLTLEIVVKTLFDADITRESAGLADAMETVMESFTDRMNRLIRFPVWLPVPANLRFRNALRQVERILYEIIAERRRSGEDRGDLLSMLLHAQDVEGDGGGMTDRQLRDEVVTLFMAGHETTANTLAWVWYLLSSHPQVEARLHAELDEVLDGRPPTVDDLPRLTYTDWVVTETLRLMPTVWLLGREAIEPTEVGGYLVPKGHTLWMSQWVLHRDARLFEDPEQFLPERWADGLARKTPALCLLPLRRRPEDLHRQPLRTDGGRPPAGDHRPPVPPPGPPRDDHHAHRDDDLAARRRSARRAGGAASSSLMAKVGRSGRHGDGGDRTGSPATFRQAHSENFTRNDRDRRIFRPLAPRSRQVLRKLPRSDCICNRRGCRARRREHRGRRTNCTLSHFWPSPFPLLAKLTISTNEAGGFDKFSFYRLTPKLPMLYWNGATSSGKKSG